MAACLNIPTLGLAIPMESDVMNLSTSSSISLIGSLTTNTLFVMKPVLLMMSIVSPISLNVLSVFRRSDSIRTGG